MNTIKIAWRNVWRNHRRSGITIAAMTLALTVELLYSGMVAGLILGMEDDATAYELGDVQIFAEGYLTRPSLYSVVEAPDAIIEKLEAKGFRATPRLYGGGLAAAGDLSAGARLVGIEPKRDAETMELGLAVAQGKWLDDGDPYGVVVGRGLARSLSLDLGDEVVVLSQAADGSTANEVFVVRGILMSVAGGLDRSGLLMTAVTFREMMVFPRNAHTIFVRKPKDMELTTAKAEVLGVVGEGKPHPTVKTWKEVNPFLAQYIDSVQGVIVVVYLILYLAVAILILNAMLMAVFERVREFGVLKAIGFGPLRVVAIMVVEGALQAAVATLIAAFLATPVMWYLEVYGVNVGVLGGMQMADMTMPAVWNGHYTVDAVMVPVLMLHVIVLLAALYPATKAAWINPVRAMRHQ